MLDEVEVGQRGQTGYQIALAGTGELRYTAHGVRSRRARPELRVYKKKSEYPRMALYESWYEYPVGAAARRRRHSARSSAWRFGRLKRRRGRNKRRSKGGGKMVFF